VIVVSLVPSIGTAFDATIRQVAAELCDIAAEPLFREAVSWQSLNAAEALDGLARTGPGAPRNSRRREREIVVTRYWQRYCARNDTIGFFGPVCWATFEPDGVAVAARPGPGLVRRRVVDLEWRALSAPGHAMGALVFFNDAHQILISGDALWQNGYGIVMPPELDPAALPATRATLEMIAGLDARCVIPGHGEPFTDVRGALERAFARTSAALAPLLEIRPPGHVRQPVIDPLCQFSLTLLVDHGRREYLLSSHSIHLLF